MENVSQRASLVRRLPRALILALAIAVVGGGAIGFAAADTETTFQVPPPMGGDEAVYSVSSPGSNWDDRQAHIQVHAPEPLMLEDGRWVSASLMRAGADAAKTSFTFGSTELEFVLVGWQAAYVDAATGRVVATSDGGVSGSGSSGSSNALLPILGGSSDSSQHVSITIEFETGPTACGVRSPLQQRALPVGEKISMEGCGDEGGAASFRVVGLRQLEGKEALLLTNGKLGTQMWYQSGLPYPVRFEFGMGTPEQETWTMTGFTRGTDPLVPGAVPDRTQPVPIKGESVTRLGPALAGFTPRFPLEQAVQLAIEQSQEVADFTAAHPDWFLRGAQYEEEEQEGEVSGSWWIRMRGGPDELWMSVNEPSGNATLPAELQRLIGDLQNQAGLRSNSDVYVWDSAFAAEEPAWPAACRPDQLPSIGTLAQRWAQMERRPVSEANAYGFRLDCFGYGDEVAPSWSVMAGDARVLLPSDSSGGPLDPPQTQNTTQVLRMLAVDERGDLAIETTEAAASSSSWGALQEPSQQAGASPIEQSAKATWSIPGGPVAASITFVSLLAAVGYWLWPLVKAGPLALFSRVQGPQLLQHPVRAELVQRIEAQPGIHYQDLVRAMGKGRGAVEHHLRKLQASGLVKSIATTGYTCYFPAKFDHRVAAGLPLLKSDGARAILAAVQTHPGASASTIVAATGLSQAAVNHHLQRLGAAGLISISRNGRSLAIQPTALGGQVAAAG